MSANKEDRLSAALNKAKKKPDISDINDKVLNSKELMALLKISDVTLLKLINDPKDPIPAKKVGREWRFTTSQVLAWIKNTK